jgi:hypothetical protein
LRTDCEINYPDVEGCVRAIKHTSKHGKYDGITFMHQTQFWKLLTVYDLIFNFCIRCLTTFYDEDVPGFWVQCMTLLISGGS